MAAGESTSRSVAVPMISIIVFGLLQLLVNQVLVRAYTGWGLFPFADALIAPPAILIGACAGIAALLLNRRRPLVERRIPPRARLVSATVGTIVFLTLFTLLLLTYESLPWWIWATNWLVGLLGAWSLLYVYGPASRRASVM